MKNVWLTTLLLVMVASACSGAKEQLGLERSSPDEFAVVKRAPLSMPPDYRLQKPRPGAPRPQEQSTADQAKEAMFGTVQTQDGQTPGEATLLSKAGAQAADPSIRQKIDAETTDMAKRNVPVAKKILGLGGDANAAPASVVDAKAEAERLLKNKEQGKPATAGDTPAVER